MESYNPSGYESSDDEFSAFCSDDEKDEFIVSTCNYKQDQPLGQLLTQPFGQQLIQPLRQPSKLSDISITNHLTNNFPDLNISFNKNTCAQNLIDKNIKLNSSHNLIMNEKKDKITRGETVNKKIKDDTPNCFHEIDNIIFMESQKYSDLEDDSKFQLLLNELLDSFNDKKNVLAFAVVLQKCWDAVSNVFTFTLYIIKHLGKKVFHINLMLRNLSDYLQNCNMDSLNTCNQPAKTFQSFQPNYLDKLKAFQYIAQSSILPNLHLFEKCFQVRSGDKSQYILIVEILLDHHEYIKASRCASLANLQSEVIDEKIFLPLLFQGHIQELEKYLNGHINLQKSFLTCVDTFVQNEDNIGSKIREYRIPKVRFELLSKKVLVKLAIRLAKLYNISESVIPNVNLIQSEKSLRYLVYRRFVINDLLADEWSELIKSCTNENPQLQLLVINALIDYNRIDEAASFATYFKLPADQLPSQLDCTSLEQPHENEESWEVSPEYYCLKIPIEKILWVDTKQLFLEAILTIQKEGPAVGFDAEWKPSFASSVKTNVVSIIQLATYRHIYLFDMLTLKMVVDDETWLQLGNGIFGSPNLFIIGYGCQSDFPNIFLTIPALQQCKQMYIVDIATYHAKIKVEKGLKTKGGLSELVEQCLGCPLDKRQQMSNWDRRPLRPQQIYYAALDAYCLLEVYSKLSQQFPELKSDQVKKKIQFSQSKLEKKQMNAAIPITEKVDTCSLVEEYNGAQAGQPLLYSNSNGPVAPGSVKVVCDGMLQGLGRSLRSCGLDVYPSSSNLEHRQLVEISKNENRVVLTSGAPYHSLKQHVGLGNCVNVIRGDLQTQMQQVFRLFNIRLAKEDIFSRCQTCNSSELKRIDGSSIKLIGDIIKDERFKCLTIEELIVHFNPNYILPEESLNILRLIKSKNLILKLSEVPEQKYKDVLEFFVCVNCGKVYWEGLHHDRTLNKFAFALN